MPLPGCGRENPSFARTGKGTDLLEQAARLLIVGAGAISEQFHVPAALRLAGAEQVLLADPDAARRKQMAKIFGLPRHADDFRSLLSEADCALVATPPHLHEEIGGECLRHGLPVLCEKPLANTADACRRLAGAASRAGRLLAVCHHYRFFPNRLSVREHLVKGTFGAAPSIEIDEGVPASWPSLTGYTFRKDLVPGGVLLNNGIHSLDFILWCLGAPEEIDYRDDAIGGLESNAEATLRYAGGAMARLRISRTAARANAIRIAGAGRSARLGVFDFREIHWDGGRVEVLRSCLGREISTWVDLGVAQLENFLAAARGEARSLAEADSGVAVLDLVDACYGRKRLRALPLRAPLPGAMW